MSDYLYRLEVPADKMAFTVCEALDATSETLNPPQNNPDWGELSGYSMNAILARAEHSAMLDDAVQKGAVEIRDPLTGKSGLGSADESWLLSRSQMRAFCDLLAIELVDTPREGESVGEPQPTMWPAEASFDGRASGDARMTFTTYWVEPSYWVEGAEDLQRSLRIERAEAAKRERAALPLVQGLSPIPSAIAMQVSAFKASRPAETLAVSVWSMSGWAGPVAPTQPVPRIPLFSVAAEIERHRLLSLDREIEAARLKRFAELKAEAEFHSGLDAAGRRAQPPAAVGGRTHSIARRPNSLSAIVDRARLSAQVDGDWPSAWALLVEQAKSESRPAPLLGYVEEEGIKYQTDSAKEPVKFLSREAFRRRFGRGAG